MATALGSYATTATVKSRAGLTDTTDDALIATLCDQVNMYIERETGRILAPIAGTPTLLYDGDGSDRLWLPVTADATYPHVGGVRAIAKLELADGTGADYVEVDPGDYFLRGRSAPAAPFDWLFLSDRPAGPFARFPRGFATVRLTATVGWAAIPDDVADVALTLAVRMWHARQSGQQDIVGTDETGNTLVSRFLSLRDRNTLRAYTLVGSLA